MDVPHAIRSRRTHKVYGPEPVPAATILQLVDLARWAPNHRLTEPWRFRVVGPKSLAKLIAAGSDSEAEKLRRAPTLVVASAKVTGDPYRDREDVLATACAVYIILLAAHARGIASYWRTPALLETPEGRAAVGLPAGEEFVSLIYLGTPLKDPPVKERRGAAEITEFLD
jgi:nitroreductase